MNKFIIVKIFCIIFIQTNYGQEDFEKYPVTQLPENSKLFDIPTKNVTLRGPLPAYVNWVKRGFNTTVKRQGLCRSCYAFSSLGAIEAQYFIKTKQLIKGSEQNVVDCTVIFRNEGCVGGWSSNVFEYANQIGIGLEQDYPYNANEHKCKNLPGQDRLRVKKYYRIRFGDEKELKKIIATIGPVSASMDASNLSFKKYNGDYVYFEPNCRVDKYTHEVLIVGYGTTYYGQDYWLVKNSWGPNWGIGGYMKIARNVNNHCGIASHAVYPRDVHLVFVK